MRVDSALLPNGREITWPLTSTCLWVAVIMISGWWISPVAMMWEALWEGDKNSLRDGFLLRPLVLSVAIK